MKKHKVLLNWLPAIVMCVLIFYASSIQNAEIVADPVADFGVRKIVHFFVYFVLYILFFKATKNYKISLVLTILYGISDEIHQYFVPTRGAKVFDVVIDSLGALFANILLWKYFQHLPKILKKWLLN